MDAEQFRGAAHAAIEEIIEYNGTLGERRIVPEVTPGYLCHLMPHAAPVDPEPWSAVQPDVEKLIIPGMTHWQHPGFMAFYPADTSYPAMLGELYSAAFNIPGFNWISSPISTELEIVVMDWLAKMLNLPDCFLSQSAGGGMITSTTSEATICAIVAARNRIITKFCRAEGLELSTPEWEDRASDIASRLVVLASDQTHSCTRKGALITGVRYRSITTTFEDDYTVCMSSLKAAIQQCEHQGLIPFFLTLSMGTTSTCAVDPVAEITKGLSGFPNIWVHVDAAYAGSALVCDEYKSLSTAFRGVDSFVFNMHKWLAVTFDASCAFFRNKECLISSLSLEQRPPFLRCDLDCIEKPVEYNDWQLMLGRRFRALKVWFVLRTYGTRALQEHVRKGIRLAAVLYNLLKSRTDLFDVFSGPAFGLVTFSSKVPSDAATSHTNGYAESNGATINGQGKLTNGHKNGHINGDSPRPRQPTQQDINNLTRSVLAKVNASGKVFLTETTVDGKMLIRVSCGGQNTERSHILSAYETMVEASETCQQELRTIAQP